MSAIVNDRRVEERECPTDIFPQPASVHRNATNNLNGDVGEGVSNKLFKSLNACIPIYIIYVVATQSYNSIYPPLKRFEKLTTK